MFVVLGNMRGPPCGGAASQDSTKRAHPLLAGDEGEVGAGGDSEGGDRRGDPRGGPGGGWYVVGIFGSGWGVSKF